MTDHTGPKGLQTAAVLALASLFFVLAMGLALVGTGVYRSVASDADLNDTQRTALSYLTNQVRRSDSADALRLGPFGDSDAIFLTQLEAGQTYTTCLYLYDGHLRELYTENGMDFAPSDGTPILPLAALDAQWTQSGSIRLSVTDCEGNTTSTRVTPRSQGEVLP